MDIGLAAARTVSGRPRAGGLAVHGFDKPDPDQKSNPQVPYIDGELYDGNYPAVRLEKGMLAQFYSADNEVPYFGMLGLGGIVLGAAVTAITPRLRRMMHGVH